MNVVGLQRAGFCRRRDAALESGVQNPVPLRAEAEGRAGADRFRADTEHTRHLVKFIESSERGICR